MATKRAKKFKVSDAVGQLDVDLRCPGNQDGFHGLLPEPSQELVSEWQVSMAKLADEYGFKGDQDDMEAISEFLAELDAETFVEQAERTAEIHSDLFQNSPSADQITAMPPRYRQAFYGYIAGEFSPEGSKSGGKS